MSRCKACNGAFTDNELSTEQHPGVEEDLCSYCRFLSTNPNFCRTHEYQFELTTEVPVYVENFNNTVDN